MPRWLDSQIVKKHPFGDEPSSHKGRNEGQPRTKHTNTKECPTGKCDSPFGRPHKLLLFVGSLQKKRGDSVRGDSVRGDSVRGDSVGG
ncbi:hypothetical protein PVC01_030015600 [Plasmodium vivax]|uniref:Uncharacterized protein n=1 Tax=Plasmodium vivax TaxID=5855 RepID=A0A1G4H7H4_PLAVI|nr:hypothetical protein PVC01_030015600 [Plasmodium vivax]